MVSEYTNEELIAKWEEFFEKYGYEAKITSLANVYPEERSLDVQFEDLDHYDSDMAIFFLRRPNNAIYTGKEAIKRLAPATGEDVEIHLRVSHLPRDLWVPIRKLRSKHMGRFISVEGLVRKATEVRPKIVEALFECVRCGAVIKEPQEGTTFREPLECYEDQGGCGKTSASTKFKLLSEASRYVDTQKIEIQERPEILRGGAQPQRLVAYCEDDITGIISPGDRVVLNGILRSAQRGRFRSRSTLFDIFLETVSIDLEQVEFEEIEITDEDVKMIREESQKEGIYRKITASIAPTIFGLTVEKEALALQLFGGVPKMMPDGTKLRGDIHILLVGDPGTGKSAILTYMSQLAPRGIYSTGRAATAAGLCISPDANIVSQDGYEPIGHFVERRMKNPALYSEDIWFQECNSSYVKSFSRDLTPVDARLQRVWKIASPPRLLEIRTISGRSIVLTKETPLFCRRKKKEWIQAMHIREGEEVAVFDGNSAMTWDKILRVKRVQSNFDYVYDLTVEGCHSFLANGFLVHNTAAAVRDEFGEGRWTLEAGALVLADKGLALIDEIDKMDPQDRSSIHTAMEQQVINISKAGIQATLPSRCAILGAANPKFGRFDERKYISEQIDLPPTLLSRFDIIFSIIDKPHSERDRSMAEHILKGHLIGELEKRKSRGQETGEDTEISEPYYPHFDSGFLRKYVAYAKRITPVMTQEAMDVLRDKYLEIRKQGEVEGSPVPITPRQLEAFVRLSEASARARLSEVVTKDDAQRAVRIVEYWLQRVAGEEGRFDIDIVATGTSRSQREEIIALRDIIQELSGEDGSASLDEIIELAEERGIHSSRVESWIKRWSESGEIYSPGGNRYRLIR